MNLVLCNHKCFFIIVQNLKKQNVSPAVLYKFILNSLFIYAVLVDFSLHMAVIFIKIPFSVCIKSEFPSKAIQGEFLVCPSK